MKSWRGLIESQRFGELAPIPRMICYSLLAFWSIIVLFPLYWVVVTSFKEPVDVAYPPKFLPFIDYQPSLHAWRYIFVDLGNDTFRPYVNSLIVASVSTVLAVVIGSMAAYALSRIEYKPKLGSIVSFLLLLALVVIAVVYWQIDWRLAVAVAAAVFFLLMRAVGRHFKRHLGNNDILFWIISQRILPPVVAAIPIYVMFQHVGLLDTHLALIITYTTVNLPIVVWLMYD